jgi:lysozyme
MTPSESLVEFVKRWEGLKLEASPDPLVPGVWDVGYGKVIKLGKDSAKPVITREQADTWLREDLASFAEAVDEMVRPTLAQHEFDALCSLAYNVGAKALAASTLMRKLNANDFQGCAEEFPRWIRAGGRIVQGLVKRRQAERAMFEDANYQGAP